MRTLITGGAGFIGSHLTEALLATGDQVTVLDDLSTGRRENLAAVADHGLRVPQDVSVIGYDGTRMAGLRALGLTTVAQPLDELGTRAAALLCARLDGDRVGRSTTRLPPTLVERRSTAPPASLHDRRPATT